ncbi:MAG TPA: uroporphyrinogen-III synthase [Saprospiraceae bacterium]|nr:uroporphyrinogen-III synthase [Saprospiraceae bacterium]HMP24694.1 uroporphyrinogen-III synthase [Saprospiraceae bacterium]
MKPRVFISRELAINSVFLQKLRAAGYEVLGESLVAFQAVPFTLPPETDWVFFYSKKAVHFFLKNPQTADYLNNKQTAVLGPGTAAALSKRGYNADFVGNGEPETTAEAFGKLATGRRVLFPRAAHSRRSVQQLLEGQIIAQDLVVYHNEPRTDFTLPTCEYLVFTSPLNVQAYMAKYAIAAEQKIIAIGGTTAATLRESGITEWRVADLPSEEGLAMVVLRY